MKDVSSGFHERFGTRPTGVSRAPGRVNLIGEHTDYNDGFVLPMAIEHEVRVAFAPRSDRAVRLRAIDLGEDASFDLDALTRGEGWVEYPKGVAWALQEAGLAFGGIDAAFAGDVPRGAGLSSSAAVELAFARAFAEAAGLEWDPKRMARLGQRAENGWVGVQSGIMDQLASACGRAAHALLIDCRSLATSAVPLPEGTTVVVLDTGTRRGLVGSAYNERRAQCEEAARALGVDALRDVDVEAFERRAGELDPVVRKRARHVITENARTLDAAAAMRAGDPARVGRAMRASHTSLRDDYEVSSEALDAIVSASADEPGCYGARMTGAGFGGCAIALVASPDVPAFAAAVSRRYRRATGNDASVYRTHGADGAGLVGEA